MRCTACNKKLNDYETTLKHAMTGEYMDTCIDCLSEIAREVPMPVKGRKDLLISSDIEKSLDNEEDQEYNKYFKDNIEED
jgi:hypothetical protein